LSGADDLARPIRLFGTALTILSVLSLGVFAYWLAFRGVLAQVVQTGYLPVLIFLAVHVVERRDSPRPVSVAWLLVGIGAMIALYLWMLLSF